MLFHKIRLLVFYLGILAITLICSALFYWLIFIPGSKHLYWGARVWLRGFFLWGKIIWRIDYQLTGLEYVPKNQTIIIASKHQSMWETFIFFLHIPDAVFVLKRELTWIPLWGWWLARMGTVAIDRKAGVQALHKMLKAAKTYRAQNRPIIIYPEGTRRTPQQKTQLKGGVGMIYQALNVPVIPVALNSGYFFPKYGKKYAGTIKVAFQPPIKAHLPKKQMLEKLSEILETESKKLGGRET